MNVNIMIIMKMKIMIIMKMKIVYIGVNIRLVSITPGHVKLD